MSGETDIKGQGKVILEIQRLVDAWRGFPLESAAKPYPTEAPRYEPRIDGERALTETTLGLLHHWFRHEPHAVGHPPFTENFKYWPHQRRLVETFIYLYEVRGVRRTEQLYEVAGVAPLQPQRDPWAKLGGQLATGSGKTKMMSLLIAWAYLNAVRERNNPLGFGQHSILIAPGLFVRDRLLQDFDPPFGGAPVFFSDPVVPPEFEVDWNLKVYSPTTCPLRLDPSEGALIVTNFHKLLRTRAEMTASNVTRWEKRQIELLFEGGEPERLEAIRTPLIERFQQSKGLLVLNDEAHHVWDETGHALFEQKAKERAKLGEDRQEAMAWIRAIRLLNGGVQATGRVALQVDLSATLFEETGSTQKSTGKRAKTDFRPADLFRHTAMHYGLADAIRDGIVKRPILERVEVHNKRTGDPESLIREGQPNAWEKYRNILVAGIERWREVRDQLSDEGDRRKPILFILCDNRNEAKEIANFLTYSEASREDLSHREVVGWENPETKERLFVEKDASGAARSTVVEIHIGQKEEANEEDWERVRQAVNFIDRDEIPDSTGALDADGKPRMLRNPYNVVISVMMLKEGWDVRNVKVIVPLRPCDSRTLTEQTLGRGLRKMHPPLIDEDGAVDARTEELFVIEHPSFAAVLDQIRDLVEERTKDEIDHGREYIGILQRLDAHDRELLNVRLVRFEGTVEVATEWRSGFNVDRVPSPVPRLPWREEIPELEIQTFLKEAMAHLEEEGLTFTLPEKPSYHDFDHVFEAAYAIPLLRDLRASYQHKNAVKGVVKEYLERRTFALPAGIPLSFDRTFDNGSGKIALGNLTRADVLKEVRAKLRAPLHEAITARQRNMRAQLLVRQSADLESYQAINKYVIPHTQRSTFIQTAVSNDDELRVALLIDRCEDVNGWVYNHRRGVGYSIDYDWQGRTAQYHPDFIVRARIGEVFHNFIIEVKGRFDARDKEKARRGKRYCELLTEWDEEPWHYVLLLENKPAGRTDITWWQGRSVTRIADLLQRHESLPVLPDEEGKAIPELTVVADVPDEQKFHDALPVLDLNAVAGGFSESRAVEHSGWARVHTQRGLDRTMFVARVSGRSMEDGIPDGSWCIFRTFSAGVPSAKLLDGRRVVVQLRDNADPETGGQYTLKRWRVVKARPDGWVEEVELRPDNPSFKPIRMRAVDGEIRAVAEFLEVIG